jgi:hypothetical protein
MAGGKLVHGREFLPGGGDADFQPGDLPAPALLAGLGEAGAQAGKDVVQALPLGGIRAQGRAADAGLTEMILSWDWSLPLRLTSLTVIRDLCGTWQPGVSPHGSGWPGRGDE